MPAMDETFRVRRSVRKQGWICLAAFLGWAALGAAVAWHEPGVKGRAALAAAVVAFPLAMAGLSGWLILYYRRAALTIRGDRVVAHGVGKMQEVDLARVAGARWRLGLNEGNLVLTDGRAKVSIEFGSYEDAERDRMVRHFRSSLAPGVQEGWNLFAYRITDGRPRPARTVPGPGEILIRRDRWDRLLLPMVAAATLAGVAAWRMTGLPGLLALPALPVALWLLLRYSTPAEGMVARKLSTPEDPETARFFGFLLLWGVAGVGGLATLEAWWGRLSHPTATLALLGVAWFGGLLYEGGKVDRRQARRARELADLAAKARGEAKAGGDPWAAEG